MFFLSYYVLYCHSVSVKRIVLGNSLGRSARVLFDVLCSCFFRMHMPLYVWKSHKKFIACIFIHLNIFLFLSLQLCWQWSILLSFLFLLYGRLCCAFNSLFRACTCRRGLLLGFFQLFGWLFSFPPFHHIELGCNSALALVCPVIRYVKYLP